MNEPNRFSRLTKINEMTSEYFIKSKLSTAFLGIILPD